MIASFLYWLVGPFVLAFLLVKLIQRSPRPVAPDVAALLAKEPMPPKTYAAARRDSDGLSPLGVFEKLIEASDAAWRAQDEAKKAGRKGSFLVFDATGVVVEQVDA